MNETDFEKYKGQQTVPYWIQSLTIFNNRAICDRCGDIQPNYASLQTIDKWNAYHFSRSCSLAALNEADALRAEVEGLLDLASDLSDVFDPCNERENRLNKKFRKALENYRANAAIKPNAAAGEEGTE